MFIFLPIIKSITLHAAVYCMSCLLPLKGKMKIHRRRCPRRCVLFIYFTSSSYQYNNGLFWTSFARFSFICLFAVRLGKLRRSSEQNWQNHWWCATTHINQYRAFYALWIMSKLFTWTTLRTIKSNRQTSAQSKNNKAKEIETDKSAVEPV